MNIIGIESTFDDTCLSVLNTSSMKIKEIKITQNNKKHKGVIPNISSLKHIINIEKILKKINKEEIKKAKILVYCNKPGLPGSICVSKYFLKGLSEITKSYVFKVNHLHCHIFSYFVDKQNIYIPFICILLSGANTKIYMVKKIENIKVIGETKDNSIGESINKIGRYMDIKYPCHKFLEKSLEDKRIDIIKINEPKTKPLEFSFSGIITKIKRIYDLNKGLETKDIKKVIMKSFFILFYIILKKKIRIIRNKYKKIKIILCGGVAKNKYLRKKLNKYYNVVFVSNKYCEDNATMVVFYFLALIKNTKYGSIYKYK